VSKEPIERDLGGRIFFLMQMQGGLIRTAELALGIAELLCEAHYGKEELVRQRPLFAVDKETYWRVEGSWNRDGKIQGYGNFYLSIEKYNGRVTDIGCWMRLGAESDAFVQQLMAAKTPEEKSELFAKRSASLEEQEKNKGK
jgi:hypothetical protein